MRRSVMDDDRKSPLWIVVVMLVLVPILYVGSYLAMVLPSGILVPVADQRGSYDIRHYRLGGDYAEAIYWPLEQLDRRVRPHSWRERIFYH